MKNSAEVQFEWEVANGTPANVTPLPARSEPLRILIVDDDPIHLGLCERYLSKPGKSVYQIETESTGEAAIQRIQAEEFDCLVIDYYLPDINGTEVIKALQEGKEDPPPAIVLTANSGESAAIGAVRSGASDFLPKRALSQASLRRAIGNAVCNSRLKRSVAAKSRALEDANRQLLKRNDEISRFYHHVSHEVKTPLCALREFVAILRDGVVGPVSEEQKTILEHAIDSCDQITSHFNDLVNMTRLEAQKVVLKLEVSDLREILEHCAAAVSPEIAKKDLDFVVDIDADLPQIVADRKRIIQIVCNLLTNAIKFTPTSGRISVSARPDESGKSIEIQVEDTGCGIPGDQLTRIFDRLYQVDNQHEETRAGGLGLGLSIARELVMLHGGEISVSSKLGEGSRFHVSLPVNQTGTEIGNS